MATTLDNNYGLPEGFKLDEPNQFKSSSEDNYSLPEGFKLDEPTNKVEDNRDIVSKVIDKGERLITQGTIGAIQAYTAGYDIPAIVGRKISIANAPTELRQSIFSDIETLLEQKSRGEWSPEDQKEYDNLVDLIKKPEKMEKFLPTEENTPHYDVGSLIESAGKQFGVDLSPKGADEMALRWIGFIKNPAKAQELLKNGFNPKNVKEVVKALAPTGKETLRGIGAGTAIQYAAEAELGPIGTMMAAVLGDIAPSLGLKAGAGALNFAKSPIQNTAEAIKSTKTGIKQGIAKSIAAFTPKDKKGLQEALIKDFKDAGIQADAGTISGNNLFKWFQSTLNQSALTGAPLEEFKKSLTNNVVSEYKKLANGLGESIYQSRYEAGEALKSGLKEARELDLNSSRELYNSAKQRASGAQVYVGNVGSLIQELERELEPGSFKSSDQKAVLEILEQLKKDVETKDGTSKSAKVKALINDKIALNDAIDYEIQGGTKTLLKRIVEEIDKAITSHGEVDPTFAKEWKMANAKFSEHAKVFRGKAISNALKTQDPSIIFQKMNTPHGISEVRKALNVSPEGRRLFKQLSRYKLEEMIGQNMVNSTTNQLNFGTFSKILEKGQNREIARSLLGEESLKKLERLQKVSGKIAETAQRFLNTSRSGVHAADLAAAGKIMMDIGNVLAGNPWPLMESGGGLLVGRATARLLVDPEFLQLLEDAVIESEKGSSLSLKNAGIRIAEKAKTLEEPIKAAIITPSKA